MYPNVYIVNVTLNLVAGTHSITEDDLGLPKGTLPPPELASLGRLCTVNKELLKLGTALRKKTDRLLASVGVKVGHGTVVAPTDLQGLSDKLEAIRTEFYDWKQNVVDNFDDELDKWIDENAEYGALIRRYAPDLKRIKRRLCYEIDVVKFAVPTDDPHGDILAKSLARSGNDISKRLKREVADFVTEFHKGSFLETKKLVKQSLGKLRRTLLPKIQSFAALDSTLRPVWQFLESFINDVAIAIDAKPKGQKFIVAPELDVFEPRISKLMTISEIEKLMAATPSPSAVPTMNNRREKDTPPPESRPSPNPPKRSSVLPPAPSGERTVRPIRF